MVRIQEGQHRKESIMATYICEHWKQCVKIQTKQYTENGPKLVCKKPGSVCQSVDVEEKMEEKKKRWMKDARIVQWVGIILLIAGIFAEATPVIIVSLLPLFHGFYREYRLRKRFKYYG